jgi:predicted RNase H-like HicB family nuclease
LTIPKYSILIQYSTIDNIYMVSIPEMIGRLSMPCTHGDTYEDALKVAYEVIETFMEIWAEEGESVPEVFTDDQHDSVRRKLADLDAQVCFANPSNP